MLQLEFDRFIDKYFKEGRGSPPKKIAIAVSGGSDSIALLLLTTAWAKNNNRLIENDYEKRSKVEIVVFSVDHQLRAESSKEIEFVAEIAKELGLEFKAFKWKHEGVKSSVQEKARTARYDMMTDYCHQLGINTLMTAHHYDDYLENYIIRKRRFSGVLGLKLSHTNFYNDIEILRPLSYFKKRDLIAYLKTKSASWIEDPSNESDHYERNRVRKIISSMSDQEYDEFLREIVDNNKKAKILNEEFIAAIAEHVEINQLGFAIVSLNEKMDDELLIYLLSFVLSSISGKNYYPRFRSVRKLIDILRTEQKIHYSLHGCIIDKRKANLVVFREKEELVDKAIALKDRAIWDGRFLFNIGSKAGYEDYEINALSMADYVGIKKKLDLEKLANLSLNNHKSILFTLPVIKKLEKIIAIPHISYYDCDEFNVDLNITFKPDLVSRFTHFL